MAYFLALLHIMAMHNFPCLLFMSVSNCLRCCLSLIQNQIDVGDVLDELFENSLRSTVRGTVKIVPKLTIIVFY